MLCVMVWTILRGVLHGEILEGKRDSDMSLWACNR